MTKKMRGMRSATTPRYTARAAADSCHNRPRIDRRISMTVLITGGMGFTGLHTARSFLDAGEDVVITWYQTWREPSFIKDEYQKRVKVERANVASTHDMIDLVRKYNCDQICHLAVPGLAALSPAEDY